MKIDLSKEATRSIVDICLSKAGYADNVVAKVNLVLDGSYSMSNLYNNGSVQALVDRALAVGYKFDDDGAIDVFDFSCDGKHRQLPQATQDDHGSYMKGKRILGGGTVYHEVLQRVASFYYEGEKVVKRTGGFMGMFGKKTVEVGAAEGRDGTGDQHPVFTMFITDGDSLAKDLDRREIRKILKQHPDMFVQFIGISTDSNFKFLEELAGEFDNAGFVKVGALTQTTDEALMTGILSQKAKLILQK